MQTAKDKDSGRPRPSVVYPIQIAVNTHFLCHRYTSRNSTTLDASPPLALITAGKSLSAGKHLVGTEARSSTASDTRTFRLDLRARAFDWLDSTARKPPYNRGRGPRRPSCIRVQLPNTDQCLATVYQHRISAADRDNWNGETQHTSPFPSRDRAIPVLHLN